MTVFLIKTMDGPALDPPDRTGVIADVPCPSIFADWIEQLAAEQITGGCGGGSSVPTTRTHARRCPRFSSRRSACSRMLYFFGMATPQ